VDQTFSGSTRPTHTHNNNIPRQLKYHITGGEWEDFKLKDNMPDYCMVLLCSKRQDKCSLLSYYKHAGGFFYKASTS